MIDADHYLAILVKYHIWYIWYYTLCDSFQAPFESKIGARNTLLLWLIANNKLDLLLQVPQWVIFSMLFNQITCKRYTLYRIQYTVYFIFTLVYRPNLRYRQKWFFSILYFTTVIITKQNFQFRWSKLLTFTWIHFSLRKILLRRFT